MARRVDMDDRMASRNHIPNSLTPLREISRSRIGIAAHPTDDPRVLLRRLPHPSALEDRVAAQHRDIQSLLVDNQRLAATHVALKQDLSLAQQDIRHLSAAAADVKAERDAQVREVYERSLKLESEVRLIDAMGAELGQVRADIQKLTATRKELSAKLQSIDGDLERARSELRQLPAIREEIEGMHEEIQRGRAAIEYEKKTRASNLEHSQLMEKNMSSLAREVENLRAQLANAEKRAQAAVGAANPSHGYAAIYGNQELGYGGNSFPGPYSVHQVPGGASANPQCAPGAMPHPYDMQQTNMPR